MVDSGPSTHSRRSLLRTGGTLASLAAMGGLSGCQIPFLGGSDGAVPVPDAFSSVPATAKAVGHVDVAAVREDDAIRAAVDAQLAAVAEGDQPSSIQEAMERVESRYGLDPQGLHGVLGYVDVLDRNAQPAFVAETNWSPTAVESAITGAINGVQTDDVSGVTVYTYGSGDETVGVGVLGDGRYVVGQLEKVHHVVEVSQGDDGMVAGETRQAFLTTEPGYVRVGVDVPGERLAQDLENEIVGSTTAGDLRYAFGDVQADGSNRVLTAGVEVAGKSSAQNLEDVVAGGLALYRTNLRDSNRTEREQALLEGLEKTTVSRNGTTVTVRYEASAEAFGDAVGTSIAAAISELDFAS